jgi:hypothetical protein
MSAKRRIADSAINPLPRQLLPITDNLGLEDHSVEAALESHSRARHPRKRRPQVDL